MSEFIRIQSKIDINVTPGLQYDDHTNYDSDLPNRLKVSPSWPKAIVHIKAGVDIYPGEIREWETIKALEKSGVITVGDSIEEPSEEKTKEATSLRAAMEKIEESEKKAPNNKKKKKATLEEAAE